MEYTVNTATPAEILMLIESINFPEIRGTTPMDMDYAQKLHRLATNFEAWHEHTLVGIVSVYMNNMETKTAHGSLFCVKDEFRGHGSKLFRMLIVRCIQEGFHFLHVDDVDEDNPAAWKFYERLGGKVLSKEGRKLSGHIDLRNRRGKK